MSELQNNLDPVTGLPVIPKKETEPVDPTTGLPITNTQKKSSTLTNTLGQSASGNVNLLDNMSFKDYES